jgi:hypothetical protein
VGGNDSNLVLWKQEVIELSVYPGGEWETMTFRKSACANFPDSLCGIGGTWDPDITDGHQYISFPATRIDNSSGVDVQNAQRVIFGLTIHDKTVWNASLASADSGNITYPNGKVGGVPLGWLSLGADDTMQSFASSSGRVGEGINASLFPAQLSMDGVVPSYSYGLHIGSAAFNYGGLLVFGGYNKGRVIGSVTSFADQNSVDLLDISIGVEFGASPFNFTSKEKLLSTGETKVTPDPLSPYLSLPRETCERLANTLPVNYDKSLKYYIWNTSDPLFKKIVSSPAYLSFTFPPAPGSTQNIAIKVPFALLNLTLDRPITDTLKQYFPCMPHTGQPVLGRAFLQAAFLGRNWGTKTSWLAQAPGPGSTRDGLGSQNVDIPQKATAIEGFTGSNLFNDSWAQHWSIIESQKLIPIQPNQSTPSPKESRPPSSNLSTGTKAGIGVGAAVGSLVVVVLLVFCWRRLFSKNAASGSPVELSPGGDCPGPYFHDEKPLQPQWCLGDSRPASELPGNIAIDPIEIPDTSNPRWRD